MPVSPVIQIHQGQVKGLTERTPNGFAFNSFLGIPYAKPPLGNLRFQAPQAPEPWSGVRDATVMGENCYSNDLLVGKLGGSEDCLFLNVYTPEVPSSDSKPRAVMVWIHGGGYTMGSGSRESYGPEYLIERDIVLVTINYRLGCLGFLSFEDKSLAPNNVGFRDQIFALQWVQENIQHFGGDPNNITIFGESAGGSSVQLLTLSPLSKGLFHKAIMQSGSAICPWSYGRNNAFALCAALGKEAANEAEALKILQSVTVEELIAAQMTKPDVICPGTNREIGAVVEGNIKDAFLPEDPAKLLSSGAFHKVPILIGYTSEEGCLMQMLEFLTKQNMCPSDLAECIPFTFGFVRGSSKEKEMAAKIKKHYFGAEEVSTDRKDIYSKIFSDSMFKHAIYKTVEEICKHSPEKLFLYRLSLECNLNQFAKTCNIPGPGVSHAEDLFYLFKHSTLSQERVPGSIEDKAIERMTKWWANFAKYGDPNGVEQDDLLQPRWPNVEAGKLLCFDINTVNTVVDSPEEECLALWKSIEKYAKEY